MNREMTAMFPNGIKALIVDHDGRFIKSSSMLFSFLNFNVSSCVSPTSALKFLSRDENKDIDVVLVNAEKVTACGFDFRGIVESDLSIPVIYFLAKDHVATGEEAEELLRTLSDSTYVLRTPFQASNVCDLWMVVAWRKSYLENKAKGAKGRRVIPTAVQAFMAAGDSSTAVDEERENEDRIHFKVVGTGGRGRKRKSGYEVVDTTAGSSGNTVDAGDQADKGKGKMNVTGDEHERDDVYSQQQPTTQKAALPLVPQQQQKQPATATTMEAIATTPRWNQPAVDSVVFGNIAPPTGVENMATTVTYQQEFSHSGNQQQQNFCPPLMFGPFPYQPATQKTALPLVPQQEQPAAAATMEAIATTPPRWNQPATDNVFDNIAPPMGVPNNIATTVTYEPEFSSGGNQQQQQDVCPPLMFGPFPYLGPRPPVLKQPMFVPLPPYSGTESIGGATVGASAAGAGEYGDASTSLLGTVHPGTEPDGHDELAALMAMYTESNPPVAEAATAAALYSGNSSALMAPQPPQIADGHDELAAMMAMYTESNPPMAEAATEAALYNGNSSALMAPHQHQQQIGHGVAANRAEDTDALNTTNSYINYSAAAAVAPQNVGHGVAPNHAPARQEVLNNGDNFSTYSTPLMVMAPNQVLDMASNVNEVTMAGGGEFFSNADDDASFTAPQDDLAAFFNSYSDDDASFTAPHQDLAAAPADGGDQLAPGAPDAISASLMGSPGPGPGAAMDGNPAPAGLELEPMFSPDQYDNTMFPLEALLGLDDAPMYKTGVDHQQGGAASGIAAADAAGTSLIGDADDNLDVLDDYFFMDSIGDFNNGGRE